MGIVTNITVQYDRKRQPAQYESAGAKVEFSAVIEATVGADQDHVAFARQLLGEAKTLVLTELGIVAAGTSASAHAPKPETPAPKVEGEVVPKKLTKKELEAKAAADAALLVKGTEAAAGDIPTEDGTKAQTALGRTPPPQPVKEAAAGDIPVDEVPAGGAKTALVQATASQAAAGAGELTAAAVQKFITASLVAKKFLPNVVLGILKDTYKVDRVYDIPADKLQEFYDRIKKLAGE